MGNSGWHTPGNNRWEVLGCDGRFFSSYAGWLPVHLPRPVRKNRSSRSGPLPWRGTPCSTRTGSARCWPRTWEAERPSRTWKRHGRTWSSFYHDRGYPTVLANIPEQTVETGRIRLDVIERPHSAGPGDRQPVLHPLHDPEGPGRLPSRRDSLPSAGQGRDRPDQPAEGSSGNAGAHAGSAAGHHRRGTQDQGYAAPAWMGGAEQPLQTHTTSDLRLNAMVSYDNLWQKQHSFSLQGQVSPEKTEEVNTVSVSYVFPLPWNREHMLASYAIWSDSETAFGDGFQVTGKGNILGLRYVMTLPGYDRYSHSLTMGPGLQGLPGRRGHRIRADRPQDAHHLHAGLPFLQWVPAGQGRVHPVQRRAQRRFPEYGDPASGEFEIKRLQGQGELPGGPGPGMERTQKLPLDFGSFRKK